MTRSTYMLFALAALAVSLGATGCGGSSANAQGGNKLTLFTFVKGKRVSAGNFHGYWDGQTVAQ